MKLTKLLLIITMALVSTNSVSAFTQRDLKEYKLYKSQQQSTKRQLKLLSKNAKIYKNKARLARKQGNKTAFNRYIAKLEDASFQRELHLDNLEELSFRLDEFDFDSVDEVKDVKLIALN